MENEMETGGTYIGPKVYKYYLHWAIRSLRGRDEDEGFKGLRCVRDGDVASGSLGLGGLGVVMVWGLRV